MSSCIKSNERGFTLIEMSIVLIIIGLIIGGILKGQELIESARQKNVISQVDQIRSGVGTFQDKYKSLPGDYNLSTTNISTLTNNGNNDGVIGTMATDVATGYVVDGTATATEPRAFFDQLTGANLIGGTSLITAGSAPANFATGGVASPFPSSAVPNAGYFVSSFVHEGASTNPIPRRTAWIKLQGFVAGATTTAEGRVSPQRFVQIDTKFDDSSIQHGRIRSTYATSGTAGDCGTNAAGAVGTSTLPSCIVLFDALD